MLPLQPLNVSPVVGEEMETAASWSYCLVQLLSSCVHLPFTFSVVSTQHGGGFCLCWDPSGRVCKSSPPSLLLGARLPVTGG